MCLAIPGKLISVENEDPLFRSGRVDFGGVVRRINLAYTPDAQPGDYLLIHVGFAIQRLSARKAAKMNEAWETIAAIEEKSSER